MKAQSAKQKGRSFQQYVARRLGETYNLSWGPDMDISSRGMGQSGTDIALSPRAREAIPFNIECKKQERWNVPAWWQQAKANSDDGRAPLLVLTKNRHETLAVLSFEKLLELINE